ncbi:MAG: ABC transporter permease [Acidobacteriaceae bacterium]|nr:ABC transporter permease [Acidobacteriaceae bacterium]
MALDAVWSHKFRSGLTILGIIIGITTVVTVASLLSGLHKGIVDFFQEFGPDNIFIAKVSGDPSGGGARPKEIRRKPLKPEYAEYLLRVVRSIDDVGLSVFVIPPPGHILTAKVAGYENDNMFMQGVTPNSYAISPRELKQGRIYTQDEEQRAQRLCVLGFNLAEALFPSGDGLGKSIMIDGAEYTVVGVFAPAKGGFFGENALDKQVVIPFSTARMRYPQSENFFITAKARPGMRADAIEELRAALRKIRHVPAGAEDDFNISTADSIIENFDKITNMIVLISIAISALGLLVGGIGVMNIMLVSVTERTREIGIRKAIGARRGDIVLQFLGEAVALTGAGGVIGIAFSIVVTLVVSALVPSLPASVPTWALVAGFSVSVAVGVFFGVWPAMKASRLDPVEALRYE